MIRIFFIFLAFLLNSCSFDNKSGIWTNDKKLKSETNQAKTEDLFKSSEIIKDEINPNFRIDVPLKLGNIKIFEDNNNSSINFNLDLKKNFSL